MFIANHHFHLFRRNAFVIGDGFNLRHPTPFGGVFPVETIDFVLRRSLLSQHGFLGPLDDEIASAIHLTFPRVLQGQWKSMGGQITNGGFDHDRKTSNADIGDLLGNDFRMIHVFRVANNVLNVDIQGHIGGIRNVADFGLLGKQFLGGSIVFIDDGWMQFEIVEMDNEFQKVLVFFGYIIILGTNMNGVKHLNGLLKLNVDKIIIRLNLMSNQTFGMMAFEIGTNNVIDTFVVLFNGVI